ncbi:MAG TPA: hypothetical protein DCZ91_04380 [Lachnospiraceae bacterium]|nr:hypothetical protein [Lachnospiraceae bacterium]
MRFSWRGLKTGNHTFLTFFCAGLIAGILVIQMGKSILLGDGGMFDESTLYHLKYMTVDSNALFFYVFRKRLFRLLGLAVLSTTYLGLIACMGAAFWYGLSAGAFLAALTIRYGIKGILLALISMFPQYLVYVPVLLALLIWCEELFRGIYVRGEYSAADRGFVLKKAGRLLVLIAVLIVGCMMEAYMNPYLLMGFLKIF